MRIDHPTPDRIPGLRALWREAFGDTDAFLDSFFANGFSPERCLCATDSNVAAAVYWLDCQFAGKPVAYLYALAVKKSHRRRGLARALVETCAEILTKQGCRGIVLVPGKPELFEMYRKMGFSHTLTVDVFEAEAGTESAHLRQLDAESYASLRRKFLPDGGVAQEGENLALLASYAKLCAGDDCLLAGTMEDETFVAMEFLGNQAAATGILAALGAKGGVFRTPGTSRSFAQYRSLDGSPAPTYFGLAFD